MSNAAIAFYPDSFDTSVDKLMGRQSAGESFLRGFIRHGQTDELYFANWMDFPLARSEALIQRIESTAKPINWITRRQMRRLSDPGCLFISAPANVQEAWNRRLIGPNLYSICGLTHTTASATAMDSLVGLLQAPVEPWDALICTSRAVRQSIADQQAMAMDYFRERFGPIVTPPIRLETIPLGINTGDYARSEDHRARWRKQLGIADDAIAVLYVGRYSPHAKMNPVPMAMALERAAQRTKRPIHWILAGYASNSHLHAIYAKVGPTFAPSITTHLLDGRREDVRFPIWSAADVFLSLSDNIQETFGLTPVEAMAAGLPSVISDWDGYRDLIEHEVQGFRIPTVMGRPGLGADLAVAHGNGWESYDHYVGIASMFVSVDVEAAADALTALFDNPDLRERMGAAARERARTVFDWKTVIGQYQGLWSELGAIRKAGAAKPAAGINPWRPDPFVLFNAYPTQSIDPAMFVTLSPGVTAATVKAMLRDATVAYTASFLLNEDEFDLVVAAMLGRGPAPVGAIAAVVAPLRRGVAERCLVWMAKFGLARLSAGPDAAGGQIAAAPGHL